MSECVVRMDLRENCLDCDLHYIEYTERSDLHHIQYAERFADADVYCYKEKRHVGKRFGPIIYLARPDWCPIVCALPEGHGRLVDMRDIDLMMENASSTSDESGLYSLVYRDDLDFDRLPTIVPATGRKAE